MKSVLILSSSTGRTVVDNQQNLMRQASDRNQCVTNIDDVTNSECVELSKSSRQQTHETLRNIMQKTFSVRSHSHLLTFIVDFMTFGSRSIEFWCIHECHRTHWLIKWLAKVWDSITAAVKSYHVSKLLNMRNNQTFDLLTWSLCLVQCTAYEHQLVYWVLYSQ